jgi:hypothetical protein
MFMDSSLWDVIYCFISKSAIFFYADNYWSYKKPVITILLKIVLLLVTFIIFFDSFLVLTS